MRMGKDGEKMNPIFPRLHINDTEKGGPKPPPRKKMALYEQLSVPSQRLNPGSSSFLPLPSTSFGHGGVQERIMCSPLGNSPAQSFLPGKLHSFSYTGVNSMSSVTHGEIKPSKPICHKSSNVTDSLSSADKNHPTQLNNFPSFRIASLGDEDHHRASPFSRSRVTCLASGQLSNGREIIPCSEASSSMKQNAHGEKQLKEIDTGKLNSLRHLTSQPKRSHYWDPFGRDVSFSSNKEDALQNESLVSSAKDQKSASWRKPVSLNQDGGSMSETKRLRNLKLELLKKSLPDDMIFKSITSVKSAKGNAEEHDDWFRSKLCPGPSLGGVKRNFDGLDVNECCISKERETVQLGVSNGCDDVLENSIVESITVLEMHPGDIVDAMGNKSFWKARSTIINQQKAYTVQLFELHRLIKVQKRIAGSPHLLVGGKSSLKKRSIDHLGNLSPDDNLESPPLLDSPKFDPEKQDLNSPGANEKNVEKLPLQATYSGNSPASAAATSAKSSWCYPSPGSQWLIPVMSPSEGLVYKPYAGPCPPLMSPAPPFYRSCGSMNQTPGSDEFLNTPFGLAPSQHGSGMIPGWAPPGKASFAPPFTMPCSKAEQMQSSHRPQSNGNNGQFPICSPPSQISKAMSSSDGKLQALKESDLQGSSASSPSNREKGDALALFPLTPTVEGFNQVPEIRKSEQQTQVIKVVPHNPRAANESAARIFQSIQEERKKL